MNCSKLLLSIGLVLSCAAGAAAQLSNVDPINKWCWGENVGFINWRDAGGPAAAEGVTIGPTVISGFAWGENIGWINMGDGSPASGSQYSNGEGSDCGVNIDPDTGDLFGLAWGENIGWINFDTRAALTPFSQQARLDRSNLPARLRGYAWAPNIGWLNLDDTHAYVAIGCSADFNCSGSVTVQDMFDFLGAFFAGCDASNSLPPCGCRSPDVNGSGLISVQDIFDFLEAYFTGCS